ncbi:uncharacterized protein [Euphorbia lathyris]|uniref:uncharacterized protein n=1 Tax=Euphorbia lathyris TaxID=212925 RepID=UPI0033143B98
MRRTEDLSLIRVRNLKNVMYQLEDYEFLRLKKMIVAECDELEFLVDKRAARSHYASPLSEGPGRGPTTRVYWGQAFPCQFNWQEAAPKTRTRDLWSHGNNVLPLRQGSPSEFLVDTPGNWILATSFWELKILHLSMLPNLKQIWHGKRPIFLQLDNLKEINISFCHKLTYVFPMSMAKGLKHLQSIEILECREMEGIFYKNKVDDKTDDNAIDWNCIRNLHLHSLPNLIGFMVQKDTTDQCGVHDDQFSNEDVATNQPFTNDENCISTAPSSISQGEIMQTNVSNKQVSLINEDVIGHTEMHCAFSSRLMKKRLEGLEKLKIAFCDALKVIFSFNENHLGTSGVLKSLKELELFGLRNLMHIWFQIPPNITGFQNLQLLVLFECYNSYLFSPQVAKLLVQLKKIQITRREKMEEIVLQESDKEVEATMDEIVFPQLKALELQYMPNLRIFYGGTYAIKLPLLESLKLNQCNKMESFSYGSLSTPMLERAQINGSSYSLVANLNATIKRLKTDKL